MKRLTIAVVLAAGILIPGIRAVSAVQERPAPTLTYQVESGDTLWDLARDLGSGRDPRAVVHELMELNDLRSPTLYPGQTLRLPGR